MANYSTGTGADADAMPILRSSPSPTPPFSRPSDTDDQLRKQASATLSPASPTPPWASVLSSDSGHHLGRRYSLGRHSSARRGGRHTGRHHPLSFRSLVAAGYDAGASAAAAGRAVSRQATAFFVRLPPTQRVLVVVAGVVALVLGIVLLVYSHRIFAALGPVAQGWHDMRGGWLLVWLLVFVTAFPPLIGYSTACTTAGIVYGFPYGWPLAATASVLGSTCAFFASRGVLSRYVDRLVGGDRRFVALGHVLRHDGLWVLAAVRFCPLPYSLSNGFLATVPSITPAAFALSTAIASPKLLVHVFIGSRLAKLAEEGDAMSAGDKAINYLSMIVFGLVGVGVGIVIFRRTMARAAEIEADEAQGGGTGSNGNNNNSRRSGHGSSSSPSAAEEGRAYADSESEDTTLLDPDDADVAALMDDDDISLWATDHFVDGDGSGESLRTDTGAATPTTYRDDDDDDHMDSAKPVKR